MRTIDRRLEVLEARFVPADRYCIYQESMDELGMFRRGEPPGDGALLTVNQVATDAAGATAILIVYEAREVCPSIPFAPGTAVIFLTNNHREDA